MKPLHNQIDKRLLKQQQVALKSRITLSFYKYFQIADPASLRDSLYSLWDSMRVLGRVYIAPEGINAQVSVDTSMFEIFKRSLNETGFLRNVRLNVAIEDNGNSFFVLKVQLKKKIVADGLRDETFDSSDSGKHLNAVEFNALTAKTGTIVVDMRNHYESEVGHFKKKQ